MRVNKTIRDYIDQEVERRLMVKYDPLRKEAIRQSEALRVFNVGIREAGQQAAKAYVAAHMQEVSDFAEENFSHMQGELPCFIISNRFCEDNVHQWREQFRKEKEDRASKIAAILELGGDKADLERQLQELDAEVAA